MSISHDLEVPHQIDIKPEEVSRCSCGGILTRDEEVMTSSPLTYRYDCDTCRAILNVTVIVRLRD